MNVINLSVQNREIRAERTGRDIVEGNVGFDAIVAEFDSEWDGLSKRVTFESGDTTVTVPLDSPTEIPWECLNAGTLRLSIVGLNAEGTEILRTAYHRRGIPVSPRGADLGDEQREATADIVQQAKARLDELEAEIPQVSEEFASKMQEWDAQVDEAAEGAATQAMENLQPWKRGIENELSAIPKFDIKVVQALPETGVKASVYLVPLDGEGDDLYQEWLWVENRWEMLGSARVDLSDYLTDVKMNGAALPKTDGAVEIPFAADGGVVSGVVNVNGAYGISSTASSHSLYVNQASNAVIDGRSSVYRPITTGNLDYAVKCAMGDGNGAAWDEQTKKNARERMGIWLGTQAEYDALGTYDAGTVYWVGL